MRDFLDLLPSSQHLRSTENSGNEGLLSGDDAMAKQSRFLSCLYPFLIQACGAEGPKTAELLENNLFSQEDYYQNTRGLEGEVLKDVLHNIIRQSQRIPYNTVWPYLKIIDEDPSAVDQMLMVYSQNSLPKISAGGGTDAMGWNREHVWPSSRGFSRTDMPAHSDLHNLRPCEVQINRSHGDMAFGEADQGISVPGAPGTLVDKARQVFEPNDRVKGDVARTLFYMDVRYQGDHPKESDLRLLESLPSKAMSGHGLEGNGYLPNLSTLLRWHQQDPVDQRERQRNDNVFKVQKNRNPFIDKPDFALKIYSSP
jgi:endonuclease I